MPFGRQTELAKMYAHVHDERPVVPGVEPWLAAVVARAMARDPADRFASAAELAAALASPRAEAETEETGVPTVTAPTEAAAMAEAPTRAGPPPPPPLSAPPRRVPGARSWPPSPAS